MYFIIGSTDVRTDGQRVIQYPTFTTSLRWRTKMYDNDLNLQSNFSLTGLVWYVMRYDNTLHSRKGKASASKDDYGH